MDSLCHPTKIRPRQREDDRSHTNLGGLHMAELPRIISVDDHVVEPPELWQERLPTKYRERGPRIERRKLKAGVGGTGGANMGFVEDANGQWCDVWLYEDLEYPFMTLMAARGF